MEFDKLGMWSWQCQKTLPSRSSSPFPFFVVKNRKSLWRCWENLVNERQADFSKQEVRSLAPAEALFYGIHLLWQQPSSSTGIRGSSSSVLQGNPSGLGSNKRKSRCRQRQQQRWGRQRRRSRHLAKEGCIFPHCHASPSDRRRSQPSLHSASEAVTMSDGLPMGLSEGLASSSWQALVLASEFPSATTYPQSFSPSIHRVLSRHSRSLTSCLLVRRFTLKLVRPGSSTSFLRPLSWSRFTCSVLLF